jgi:hypothetical protein
MIREAEKLSGRNLRAEDVRDRMAQRSREEQQKVREIGPPPGIVNPSRRDYCKPDLLAYLKTYHPEAFPLEFSDDHLQLIETIQRTILEGGNVVVAMPRGSGKTTICQRAEIWAALYGHRKYPMLIAADDSKFKRLLKGIKTILENNVLLAEDFPEIIHPVRSLQRIANRANFQMCRDEPTYMAWGTEQVVFPTIAESIERTNAGVVIGGGGLTSAAIRGGVATTPAGEQRRPDCVLVDDPQTRKSAKSPAGVQEREDIVSGDILGMAGPGRRMAAMVACTVIYQADLAARLIDSERSPDWHAIKVQTIQSWPDDMTIWEKYDNARRQELLGEAEEGSANKFYEEHREQMDAGGQVYWPARVDPGKLSALQTAMDDYLRDPRAFAAERQNTPEEDLKGDLETLNPLSLVKRTTTHSKGLVPADASILTAHIDVQEKLLYWTVVAWSQAFRGYVLDYGAYPEPSSRYFQLGKVRKTLQTVSPGNDMQGSIRVGIQHLITYLSERVWRREDKAEMHITRGLVDSRYLPAYGTGIGAKHAPMAKYAKRTGLFRGHHWVMERPSTKLLVSAFVDTNYWKTRCHQALTVPQEHSAAITLYRAPQSHHQLFADHLASERATRVEARGRVIDEWTLPSNKPDNHFWDNLIGCMAAASMSGISREEIDATGPRKPQRPQKRVRQLKF